MGLVWLIDGAYQRDAHVAPAAPSGSARPQAEEGAVAAAPAPVPEEPGGGARTVRLDQVMSSPVVALHVDEPLRQAMLLMARRGIFHVPVVDGEGALVGIVSDRDLLRHLRRHAEAGEGGDALEARAGEAMTSPVLAATPDSTLHEAAHAMAAEKISSLPVIDDRRIPLGIVTVADVLGCAAAHPGIHFWA